MRRLIKQAGGGGGGGVKGRACAVYFSLLVPERKQCKKTFFPNPGVSRPILPAMADSADEDNWLAEETLRAVVRTVLEDLQASQRSDTDQTAST